MLHPVLRSGRASILCCRPEHRRVPLPTACKIIMIRIGPAASCSSGRPRAYLHGRGCFCLCPKWSRASLAVAKLSIAKTRGRGSSREEFLEPNESVKGTDFNVESSCTVPPVPRCKGGKSCYVGAAAVSRRRRRRSVNRRTSSRPMAKRSRASKDDGEYSPAANTATRASGSSERRAGRGAVACL